MEVAIVVPVYNVEKYLSKCIESLIKQTIRNYNIYLIDDGSTDSSGLICDKYSNKYNFIKTYHKKNGGLSDARNFGVMHADENYVTFVDSDDTVREDYIEKLTFALEISKADISIANFIPVSDKFTYKYTKTENIFILEDSKIFLKKALLGHNGSLSACAKLFNKKLLINHPFPKGKLYEDMEIIFDIFNNVKNVAYIDENIYFYLNRENSIVQSRITEKHLYGINSCIHMLEKENKFKNELSIYIKCRIVQQACGHLPNLVKFKDYEMFLRISRQIKVYIKSIIFNKNASLKLKIRSFSYLLSPHIGIIYANFLFTSKKTFIKIKTKGDN